MSRNVRMVSTYSLIHFAVDFSSIAVLTGVVMPVVADKAELVLCMLVYNAIAFAFQLPIGVLGDLLNKNALLSAFGCLLVGVSCFVPNIILVCVAAGLGNACFHIGGGIDILNISNKKATLPGIYVAPGALGLFLAVLVVKKGFNKFYLLAVLMFFCAAVLYNLYFAVKTKWNVQNTIPDSAGKTDGKKLVMALLLLTTVFLRSYTGTMLNYSFKAQMSMAVLFVFGVVLGKALGGIIADKIGWLKTCVITLTLAAVLFAFSFRNAAAALLAVLLFNMTMPITLTALANSLKFGKGFAFGLTTFALFAGLLSLIFGLKTALFSVSGLFGITILSCMILSVGLKLYADLLVKHND